MQKANIKSNNKEVNDKIVQDLTKRNNDAIEADKKAKHDYRVKLQQINRERFA